MPICDHDGTFAGYTGSCIDITEQIEAREALRRAQEEELRQLKGLIPICAWCKKVRDDQGYWIQVEVYVAGHSKANFSHDICPECEKKIKL